jgi:hypothetical protein
MMRTDPARYSVLIGNLPDGFGADHILWGTDTPVIGPPHWQIEAFQTFTIPEELAAQDGYSQLTREVKNKIFGENAAPIHRHRRGTSGYKGRSALQAARRPRSATARLGALVSAGCR